MKNSSGAIVFASQNLVNDFEFVLEAMGQFSAQC